MMTDKYNENPSTLYRYVPFDDRLKSIIVESKIHFASPIQYNDPFDCSISLFAEGTEQEKRDNFNRLIKNYSPPGQIISGEEMLEREKSIDLKQMFKEGQQKLKEKIGVLSLSAKNDNILMWAHYANQHNGVCLEFSLKTDDPFFVESLPVEYSADYPRINYYRSTPDKLIKTLLVKFEDWKYEEEWRLINFNSGPGMYSFSPNLLTGIIFGLKMTKKNQDTIQNWIKQGRSQPILYKAVQNDNSFGLNIKELTTSSSGL